MDEIWIRNLDELELRSKHCRSGKRKGVDMEVVWRRFLEVATVLSLVLSVWVLPSLELRWFVIGATTAVLVLLPIYETMITRAERRVFQIRQEASNSVAKLHESIQMKDGEIARLQDPELMAIYREDERERLRIQRESIERTTRHAHESRQMMAEIARKQLDLS